MTVATLEPDHDLLTKFRDGDEFAFQQFAERHFDDTCAYVRGCVLDESADIAEEATNTAINDVAKRVQSGASIDNPAGYVRLVARNKAYNLIRNNEQIKRKPPQRVELIDVEPHVHTERIKQSVSDAMEILTDDERTIIQSIYYDGRSLRETADWLGCNLHNVRKLHDSTKEKLRKQLADEFA
jgi:RNA polymerase sigma factor (sigma-70 family)